MWTPISPDMVLPSFSRGLGGAFYVMGIVVCTLALDSLSAAPLSIQKQLSESGFTE